MFQNKKRPAGSRSSNHIENSSRPNRNKLKVFYVNARSLRNKFSDLEEIAFTENYDVIGVTESWLNIEVRDYLAEYKIPGYITFDKSRVNKQGGGILFYVKASLNPVILSKPIITNVDTLFLLIKNNYGRKLVLTLIYRPPAQTVQIDNDIFYQISEISDTYDTVILGDFNLPVTKWGGSLTSHHGHDLYNNLKESSLFQFVQEPTRDNHVLDLVLATKEELIENLHVGDEFSTSDHREISFSISFTAGELKESKEKVPDYRKANFRKLNSLLNEIDWSQLRTTYDINIQWKIFTHIYSKAVQECIPTKNRRPMHNTKPKWWNKEIAECLRVKREAHNRLKLFSNSEDHTRFIELRRRAKRLIKDSKRATECHVANQSKTNPKEFYNFIREKRMSTSSIGPIINENGDFTNNEEQICSILNNFFASVFTKEDLSNIPMVPAVQNYNNNTLNGFSIAESDVSKCIDKLKVTKSPGPDMISPRVLKEAKSELVKPLTVIFNKSLQSGLIPCEWKLANVTPIFKKGSKSLPSNYRPISLTSVACKMLETIIRDKLVKHLEGNSLLNNTQHGFRNKRSCLTNLLDFLYDILNQYDESKAVDIIYLDFQKAFDKVPHKRLLIKLKSHGIQGNVLRWVENWLNNRKQRVVINGKASKWTKVTSGVPQGSVLGPVLFLVYINDIDNGVTGIISKFADDTKIANTVVSNEQVIEMQSNLDKLSEWGQTWQMNFNADKCKVLHIGYRNEKANYTLNGTQLKSVDSEIDLGVTISSNLKPSQQCSEVVKKANKIISLIGRSFEYKSKDTILTLYNSLVRPLLEYCVQAWCPYYHKDVDKLERVQRRVTKMIPCLRNKSYEERLKELDLFSLKHRRLRGDLIQAFKIIKGIDNMDCSKYFTIDSSNYTRGNGCKIVGKSFKSHESKNNFFHRVVNLWNGLPSDVINCNTVETFKSRLDKYVASNPRMSAFEC